MSSFFRVLFVFFITFNLFSEIKDNYVLDLISKQYYSSAWKWIRDLPEKTDEEKLFKRLMNLYLDHKMKNEDGFEKNFEEMYKLLIGNMDS